MADMTDAELIEALERITAEAMPDGGRLTALVRLASTAALRLHSLTATAEPVWETSEAARDDVRCEAQHISSGDARFPLATKALAERCLSLDRDLTAARTWGRAQAAARAVAEERAAEVRGILAGTDYASLPNDWTLAQVAQARMDDIHKYMDQVRYTCDRAEKAEAARDAALARAEAAEAAYPAEAVIEGPNIVIRVPVSAIPVAFDAWPDAPRNEEGDALYVVTDAATFAKGIVRYLNAEEEDGTTRIHVMFDGAMSEALEQGEEGVEEVARAALKARQP